PALIARLGSQAEDAGATQALDAMGQADVIILLGGIEGEPDGDLLALLQRLAGGVLGGRDQERDLGAGRLSVVVVRCEGVDLLDGLQDGLGDERRAVGPLFNPATKQVVERLGIEPSLTELLLKELGPHHGRHLGRETQPVHYGFWPQVPSGTILNKLLM